MKGRNEELALENHELRLKLAQMEQALTAEMKAEIPESNSAGEFIYIPATIVKISNNSQHNYMIIGKGSSDGITEGAGVITGKGAVGVIDAVGEIFGFLGDLSLHVRPAFMVDLADHD